MLGKDRNCRVEMLFSRLGSKVCWADECWPHDGHYPQGAGRETERGGGAEINSKKAVERRKTGASRQKGRK